MTPSEQLCQACGLCCDGTLFSHLFLLPHEVQFQRRRGLAVVTREDGKAVLPLPCRALSGRSCTTYAERPAVCRRYRCMLLEALEEGEVNLSGALSVVEEAQARVGALEAALPPEAHGVRQRTQDFLNLHFRGRVSRPTRED